MTLHPLGAKSPVDGRTDMTKLTVPFQNFANTPKTVIWVFGWYEN